MSLDLLGKSPLASWREDVRNGADIAPEDGDGVTEKPAARFEHRSSPCSRRRRCSGHWADRVRRHAVTLMPLAVAVLGAAVTLMLLAVAVLGAAVRLISLGIACLGVAIAPIRFAVEGLASAVALIPVSASLLSSIAWPILRRTWVIRKGPRALDARVCVLARRLASLSVALASVRGETRALVASGRFAGLVRVGAASFRRDRRPCVLTQLG